MEGLRLRRLGRLTPGVAVAAAALSCGRSVERSDSTGAAGVETQSGSGAGGDGVSQDGGDSGVASVAGEGGGGRATMSVGGMAGTTSRGQGGRAGDFATGAGRHTGGAAGIQCEPFPATPVNVDPECATIVHDGSRAEELIQSCDHDVTCAWLVPRGDFCFQPPYVESATFTCCEWGYVDLGPCPKLAPDQDPLCELPIVGGVSCPDEGVSCDVFFPADSPYTITYTCSTGVWQAL